jgi:hypothetical protein
MNKKYLTPECEARFLWIFKPNEKFEPQYQITLKVEGEEWDRILKEIEKDLNEYFAAQCKVTGKKLKRCQYLPWKDVDGEVLFVAKNNVEGRKKDGTTFKIEPMVVGPDREPITAKDLKGLLGQGTIVRVGFLANYWTNDAQGVGVSARLNFTQVVTPKYIERFSGYNELKSYEKDKDLWNTGGEFDEFAGMQVEDLFAKSSQG